ncbi:hypothetical protein [Sulfurimonas sediminis]|nr:hypothetical protein [Sulfurimonas sediminis]
MAVDRKQFIKKIEPGLKANTDYNKFYLNFKLTVNYYYLTVNHKQA